MRKQQSLAKSARLSILFCGITVGVLAQSAAYAQSTGSQTAVSEVVVTAKKASVAGGVGVPVTTTKDESIVTQAYIKHQMPSANFAQIIDTLPGVTYSTEDPTGVLSSDFRLHGVPGDHVSFTLDGTPLNDTGNYAIYPGEYTPSEVIDHVTVNIGQTEIDSPSASALGGTVNIVGKTPPTTFGAYGSATGGSYDYRRGFAEVDSGEVGPLGTRGYLSVNYVDANKYKGDGDITGWGSDGKIYQPLKGDDFVALAYTWQSNRPYFYESSSFAQIAQYGRSIDYNTQWVVPTAINGHADGVAGVAAAPGQEQGNDSNYWALHPNPVDFGDLRGSSRFDLTHGFTLTVDPYLFYTLANGGGTTSLSEKDKRLIGSATPGACGGVDLNHDGDCLDTVLVYSPSNTQTHRYGVNSSLIWDLNPENRFQLAYSFDYGHHRQTGDFTGINQQTGSPDNVFGGKQGYGSPITALDGTELQSRNRFSVAQLNQVALNYIGKFDDDKLHINLGIRDPYFQRQLNNFCYLYNGSTQYCDSISQATIQTAYNADAAKHGAQGATATNLTNDLGVTVKYGPNGLPNFRFPFHETYNYNKVLPNIGASFNFDDHNQIYVTYDQSFSAPKTDDLYVSGNETVQPEVLDEYGAGYRYQASTFMASANLWYSTWTNHIVSSVDPQDPTLTIDRNVGDVHLYGLDLESAWQITSNFSLYGSGTLMKSALQSNYDVAVNGVSVPLPVKGKELVLAPDVQFALRGQYTVGDFSFGLQAKYEGKRYLDDINSVAINGVTVFNFDAEYNFQVSGLKSVLQLNFDNLFGANYYSRATTSGNYTPVVFSQGTYTASSGPFVYIGAPPTAYLTLKVQY